MIYCLSPVLGSTFINTETTIIENRVRKKIPTGDSEESAGQSCGVLLMDASQFSARYCIGPKSCVANVSNFSNILVLALGRYSLMLLCLKIIDEFLRASLSEF